MLMKEWERELRTKIIAVEELTKAKYEVEVALKRADEALENARQELTKLASVRRSIFGD